MLGYTIYSYVSGWVVVSEPWKLLGTQRIETIFGQKNDGEFQNPYKS